MKIFEKHGMKNFRVVDPTCDDFTATDIGGICVQCWTDEGAKFAEEYNDIANDKHVTHNIYLEDLVEFYLKHHKTLPLGEKVEE
jgi:hypothetical protein